MLVREYLHQSGATKEQLADLLGHKTTSMVTKKMEVEMPIRWTRLLDESDGLPLTAVGGDDSANESERESNTPDDWERAGRESDSDPNKPDNANQVVGPKTIKLSTVEDYIGKIYSGAAYLARSKFNDEIASDVIIQYTPEFSEAWIEYIKSDPRIMAYLEKLMVGTPLGNLIGVHAIAIGSYTIARVVSRDIARAYTESESNANNNGTSDDSTANLVG